MTSRQATFLTTLAFGLAIFVFLKNAWVAEDAYIVFRSIEQLFAGHGPVWNPHERVQTFTSPLWFWLLAGVRLFTTDLYLGTLCLSFGLFLGTLLVLHRTLRSAPSFLLAVALLVGSTGFFDYTSSGLENGLAYFLIALYLKNYLALLDGPATKNRVVGLLALAGLLVCVRHDLGFLMLPMSLFVVKGNRRLLTRRQWAGAISLALLPLLAWSAFSLLYYGFPFPNTAYAKLNTGIPRPKLLLQSLECLYASFVFDGLTLLVVLSAVMLTFDRATKIGLRFLGYGILASLGYFVWAGGDFMQGRFLSYAYLVSVVVILRSMERPDWRINRFLAAGLMLLFGAIYQHTPLNSPVHYENKSILGGVADERGFYFPDLSLASYLKHRREGRAFPSHEWAEQGRTLRGAADPVSVQEQIGLYGYLGGLDRKIVDPLALSDPLLSRLPVTGWWRVGHYRRVVPIGYLETVRTGVPSLKDARLNEYYTHLKLVTESPDLLAPERLKTIARFNLGEYNRLLSR